MSGSSVVEAFRWAARYTLGGKVYWVGATVDYLDPRMARLFHYRHDAMKAIPATRGRYPDLMETTDHWAVLVVCPIQIT